MEKVDLGVDVEGLTDDGYSELWEKMGTMWKMRKVE